MRFDIGFQIRFIRPDEIYLFYPIIVSLVYFVVFLVVLFLTTKDTRKYAKDTM